MTLLRLTVLLLSALITMAAVVVLRAEATRLHHAASRIERNSFERRQTLRDRELAVARLRSPELVQDRLTDFQQQAEALKTTPAADLGPAPPGR